MTEKKELYLHHNTIMNLHVLVASVKILVVLDGK
jgi:hypothetical protein